MGRPHAVAGEQAELCRITVPKRIQERLEQLSADTELAQSVHRRRALSEYLDRHAPSA